MILREEPDAPRWSVQGAPWNTWENTQGLPAAKMPVLAAARDMSREHALQHELDARSTRKPAVWRALLSIRGAFLLVWFCLWALIAAIAWGCSRSEHETLPGLYED